MGLARAALLAAVLGLVCVSGRLVFAAGFEGPGVAPPVTRAADVLGARDDAPCILEGSLKEKIPFRKNRYIFADASGSVVVEIKNKTFGPLTVTPRDRVRLVGHVDWDDKHPNEVEVDALYLLE